MWPYKSFLSFAMLCLSVSADPIRLIPEYNALQSSKTVRFILEISFPDEWHSYWMNPGDAGAPPQFLWELPPFSVSPRLIFPVPQRHESDGLITYVHPSPLRILAEWIAPQSLHPGDSATIRLSAEWLICRDICQAQKGTASLTLPVCAQSPTRNREFIKLFDPLQRSLPVYDPAWNFTVEEQGEHWFLQVHNPNTVSLPVPDDVHFFSSQSGVVDPTASIEFQIVSNVLCLVLSKGPVGLPPVAPLEGILQISNWKTSLWVNARRRSLDGAPRKTHGVHEEETNR